MVRLEGSLKVGLCRSDCRGVNINVGQWFDRADLFVILNEDVQK